MNVDRDLERQLASLYSDEGLLRAPDRVLTATLANIENTPQRRVLSRVPWRIRIMSTPIRLAVAAVAVIAVVAVGLAYLSRPALIGPGPTTTQAPSPSPQSTLGTSPAPVATHPPLSQHFASALHGISLSYPAGWSERAATEPWTSSIPLFEDPFNDVMYDESTENLKFIGVASQLLGNRSGGDWLTQTMNDPKWEPPCPAQSRSTTIDGAAGVIVTYCPDGVLTALATVEDRGYLVVLYGVGDRAWFEEILATVQLDPHSAAPTPL